MKHDHLCELSTSSGGYHGATCHCAERAYERDPYLPGVEDTPIPAPPTPRTQGTPPYARHPPTPQGTPRIKGTPTLHGTPTPTPPTTPTPAHPHPVHPHHPTTTTPQDTRS